jgi:hypothetical protein
MTVKPFMISAERIRTELYHSQEIAFRVLPCSPIMKVVGIDGVCGSLAFGYYPIDQSIEGLRSAVASLHAYARVMATA